MQISLGLSPVRWKDWLWSASSSERVSRSLARPLWMRSLMEFWAWDTPPWLLEGWPQCLTTWWPRTWWMCLCFLSTWAGKAHQACRVQVSYDDGGTVWPSWKSTRLCSHNTWVGSLAWPAGWFGAKHLTSKYWGIGICLIQSWKALCKLYHAIIWTNIRNWIFIYAVNKYVSSPYYIMLSMLGTKNTTKQERQSLPSKSLTPVGGGRKKISI